MAEEAERRPKSATAAVTHQIVCFVPADSRGRNGPKELPSRDGRMRFRERGQDVELDPAAGRVRVVERRLLPGKPGRPSVLLDVWKDPGASVTLYHPEGWNIQFGVSPSTPDAALRLSTVLDLPLRRPKEF